MRAFYPYKSPVLPSRNLWHEARSRQLFFHYFYRKNLTMAKKIKAQAAQPVKPVTVQKPAQKSVSGKSSLLTVQGLAPIIVCALYFVVHFIGDFGAYDAMGAQWMYMVALDLAVILFLIARKNDYQLAAAKVFSNIFSLLYLAFFALCGLSIFYAINPTESIVCYVRMLATIVSFFNIAIVLYNQSQTFKVIAQLLGLILFIESCQTISQFLQNENNQDFTQLIMGLKGTAGNKNIFAAGLVAKVPFVLYCLYRFKLPWKIINTAILFTAAWAIVLVSARASYLSLLLVVLMFIVLLILQYRKEKRLDTLLFQLGTVVVMIVAAFFISNTQLNEVKVSQEEASQSFGSATDRVLSITETNDESNQVRFRLWAHAVDYTKHHPVVGCGVGNWKIASIPYQRTITNDLFVPVHAHNDYLEMFAEMGIPGGLLYLSLFLFITLFAIRTYFSEATEETRLKIVFAYMAFVTYMVDAMFNFPTERPISQVFFATLAAIIVTLYIQGREEINDEKVINVVPKNQKIIFAFVSAILLVPSFYVTQQVYKSLILQRTVLGDLNNEPLKLDWKMVTRDFPSIPNLSATAQPIEAIKGRYLYEAGKLDEALVLLDKGSKANPVIGYSEFLKAGLYYKKAQADSGAAQKRWYDSARRNGLYAFWVRPKAKTYFQTLIAVLSAMKDTANIESSFREYDKYRHHQYGWNMYLLGLIRAEAALGRMPPRMFTLVDSALNMFGKNDAELLLRKKEITDNYGIFNRVSATGGNLEKVNESIRQYATGVTAFNAGQLEKAAQSFLKSVELNPDYMAALENAAICYFNLRNYAKAISLFDREIAMNRSIDGKPEYYKAIALINTGKAEEGCKWMHVAAQKKHVPPGGDASKLPEAIIKANCGGK